MNKKTKTYQPCPETATLKHKGWWLQPRATLLNKCCSCFLEQINPTVTSLTFTKYILKSTFPIVITFLMLTWLFTHWVKVNGSYFAQRLYYIILIIVAIMTYYYSSMPANTQIQHILFIMLKTSWAQNTIWQYGNISCDLSKLCVCVLCTLLFLSILRCRFMMSFKTSVKLWLNQPDICFVIMCIVALLQFFWL